MQAMTGRSGSAAGTGGRRMRRALAALLLVSALPGAPAAEFEILDPRGEPELFILTRSPGVHIEKVVPEEGYQRVAEPRPRVAATPVTPVARPEPRAVLPAAPPVAPVTVASPVTVVPVLPVEPPTEAPPLRVDEPQSQAQVQTLAPPAVEPPPLPVEAAAPQLAVRSAAEEPPAWMPEAEPPAADSAEGALLAESQSSPVDAPAMRLETVIQDGRVARVEAPRQQQAEADIALPPGLEVEEPLLQLGPGDAVTVQVFGRPEFNTTTYVGNDGRISVPLAGAIAVAGLSPADAGLRVADALRDGQFLVNPQVTITLAHYRSQQVSVLGEVKAPGRFPIESRTTVFDLLAQAGGVLETGSDVVYLLRVESGETVRHPVDLKALTAAAPANAPRFTLRGGDSIFVPRAEQYYVYGEVRAPNRYRLEPGTTVVQAISRSGGLTPRGSENRIEIKRRKADGKYETIDAELTDAVRADDVIRVKERIF